MFFSPLVSHDWVCTWPETETPPTLEPGKRAGPARCRVWVHRTESRTSPLLGLGSPDREQDQPAAESGFTEQRAGPARCRVWVHRHMENMVSDSALLICITTCSLSDVGYCDLSSNHDLIYQMNFFFVTFFYNNG